MTISLNAHTITLSCPQCGQQLKEKLGRLKRDKHITCPTCGRIAVDTHKVLGLEDSINKELAKLSTRISLKL